MLKQLIFPSTLTFLKNDNTRALELKHHFSKMGIQLDIKTGHLFYTHHFNPLSINFDLIFVRHGETYGNCGQITANGYIDHEAVKHNIKDHNKRIFQGRVDTEINQLTEFGIAQSISAANLIKSNFLDHGWEPDLILSSPLARAQCTAKPFVKDNSFDDRYFIYEELTEMSFGAWDNRRVCDLGASNPCHRFYQEQNALVKKSGINGNNIYQEAENFLEVMIRAQRVLTTLSKDHGGKKIVIFSHSMFGAALCILLGKGQMYENSTYLAFDGKKADGSYYTMPNAVPFALHMQLPAPKFAFGSHFQN